ncbi:MAG: hypothetical protein F4X99_03465 [Gammaproteobacteria bacterium]|nr:hypothetical protein [Gammaproteobacteria bacterium]
MSPSLATFHGTDPPDDIADALRHDGAAVVHELAAPHIADAIAERIVPTLRAQEPGGESFFGAPTRGMGDIFVHAPEIAGDLLLNETFLEVADAILLPRAPMAASAAQSRPSATWEEGLDAAFEDYLEMKPRDPVLGPNCHHYRLNISGARQVCAGDAHQFLHREMDTFRPFLEHDPETPERALAIVWALTDFTLENGATRLVPGSHRWPRERAAEEHEVARAVMPKGSAALWTGKTLHGLAASRDESRTSVTFVFMVDWLTTEENQFFAIPPDVARGLPERAQQLIGYRASPALGWVTDRDPDNLLRTPGGPQ